MVDFALSRINFKQGGTYKTYISPERNIFFYVVKGKVMVNAHEAKMHQLVAFDNYGNEVKIHALEDSIILLGHIDY